MMKTMWNWTKDSPLLTVIATFIITNLITIVVSGGFHLIGLLANMLPTVFMYFLSTIHIEQRELRDKKDPSRVRM